MLSQEAKVVQLALSGAEGPAAAGGVGQFDTRHFADPMKNKVNYNKKKFSIVQHLAKRQANSNNQTIGHNRLVNLLLIVSNPDIQGKKDSLNMDAAAGTSLFFL